MELGSGSLEGLVTREAWQRRRVFLTGHTGFKGGWLAVWLGRLGARVYGYALDPPTQPSFFADVDVGRTLAADTRADLRDLPRLQAAMRAAEPEVVFHLAAQPLVRDSYERPLETFMTNVVGTAHVLEACRAAASVRAVVVITTDKVYENRKWLYPYREVDRLGGHDPYSASKAAAELVTASYRSCFFARADAAHVASARAGNVIGGGDWAKDRLLPDCLRAFADGAPAQLRHPSSVRPWQHVLEPLSGYLALAQRLLDSDGAAFATAWNFGPEPADYATVGEVAAMAAQCWGSGAKVAEGPNPDDFVETELLRIDSSSARARLGWRPRWSMRKAVEQTVMWHRARQAGAALGPITLDQIADYESNGGHD
jgi:CDP-glucose 4,6-dehydratase